MCLTVFLLPVIVMADGPPDMVLLIMDQTGLENVINTPTKNIDMLQEIGAFGLMNVRTAGNLKPESTYLTAGNGKKCKGSNISHEGENNNNKVVNKYIANLKKINTSTTYSPFIGLLGNICRENNKKVAVLGNTDTLDTSRRTIVSLAMDEYGNVDMGDVSKNILLETNTPWGYQTNWSKMRQSFATIYNEANLIVIETGDTARIEKYYRKLTQNEILAYKENAIKRIDEYISYIIENINLDRTLLGIVVLSPSMNDIEGGNKLTWILFAGKGIEHGWLTSETTRRTGIITIIDILPTIISNMDIYNINEQLISGHVIKSIKADKDWSDLYELNRKITTISILRKPFIQGFIGLQLFVIILAIICIFYKKLYSSVIIRRIIEYLLLALFLVPGNFLILSMFNFSNPYNYLWFIITLSVMEIYAIVNLTDDNLKRLLLISTSLVFIILIDLAGNNYLLADSLLGYSSIIGARYYGLGNEYMGLLIGGVVISLTGIIELLKPLGVNIYYRFISAFIFLLVIFFIGAPHLGANFGGTITAIFAFTVTWLSLWRYKINSRTIFFIIFIIISLIWGIIYLDYNQVITSRTHIGKAITPLLSGDYQEIINIIMRKFRMNIKLMKWTIWTRVLLAFLVYIIILFKHPVGKLKQLLNRYSLLAAGFYGGITGSIITLLVNDSGVVASATLLFYPMLTLLYLFNYLNRNENFANY